MARRLDLRLYPIDGYTYAHLARGQAGDYPLTRHLAALSVAQRWQGPAEELAERFVATSAERVAIAAALPGR